MGAEVEFVERSGRGSIGLLTLRFRAKVILGFAVRVLALTAASMAFAYFGFERVAMAVRQSVTTYLAATPRRWPGLVLSVQNSAKDLGAQYLSISTMVSTYIAKPEPRTSDGVIARTKFLETSLVSIHANNEKITQRVVEISELLKGYRASFVKFSENAKSIAKLSTGMTDAAAAILQLSNSLKSDLSADQQRIETEASATIGETERLILMLAVGGLLLGVVLALMLGNGISRPMIAMCKAMRELAAGNFDVVLPGLGRKDEIGEMAGAVEEFKVQAVAKAERDAAGQEAQNKASGRSAPRRTDSLRRRIRDGGGRDRLQRLGLGRAARNRRRER